MNSVIPALKTAMRQSSIGLVYDAKVEKDKKTGELKANPNENAINTLKDVQFFPRNETNIMHNKFLVSGESLLSTAGKKPMQLTCGSTNYTTEGLTSQANLVHTFASTELAELY